MAFRKDQFGFGTEQPISQEDLLKMERSKLDKLLSMGEITQEEFTRMYKQLQDTISGIEKAKSTGVVSNIQPSNKDEFELFGVSSEGAKRY
tara:strand:- start:1084 stop:1356 length:273 start_codon:yes stop_codon:yes gene_type:complete